MPRPLDGHVTGSLSHRIGYGPTGHGTTEFEYRLSEEVTLPRPADGEGANRIRTRCPSCDKALTYRVYSVRTTRRRRAVWWALTALAVVLFVGGVVVVASFGEREVSDGMGQALVGAIVGGFVAGVVLVQVAWAEFGVRGHLTGWPVMAKHGFELALADEDKDALECERCGHRELLGNSGHGDYQDASARLRQHICR